MYIKLPFQLICFEIITDCLDIIDNLSFLYGKYCCSDCNSAENIFTIEISKTDNMYYVSANNTSIVTEHPLQSIRDIIYENTKFFSSVIAFHGAAIEYNNEAYLFFSPTTGGKTTLTTYLLSKGCGYISDDCVLVNYLDFTVIPFTTPIHLRLGGVDVLKALNITMPSMMKYIDDGQIKRYIYSPSKDIKSPIKIKNIYFIERNEEKNNIETLSGVNLLLQLMKSVIVPYSISKELVNIFMSIAKERCQKIYYKDMDYVYSTITIE